MNRKETKIKTDLQDPKSKLKKEQAVNYKNLKKNQMKAPIIPILPIPARIKAI
jgi:hypothetical protein